LYFTATIADTYCYFYYTIWLSIKRSRAVTIVTLSKMYYLCCSPTLPKNDLTSILLARDQITTYTTMRNMSKSNGLGEIASTETERALPKIIRLWVRLRELPKFLFLISDVLLVENKERLGKTEISCRIWFIRNDA
jgi:hypothetical protein